MSETKITEALVERIIAELSAGGALSSYTEFYEAVVARLAEQGLEPSGEDDRLIRRVLRTVAPLGATDIDNRMVAAVAQRPWYVAGLLFVLVCAAGGVIEYFVQLPLDGLFGGSSTSVEGSRSQSGRSYST